MKQIYDEATANDVAAENKQYQQWANKEHNKILGMFSTQRKQEKWNKLYPKTDLAVYGLSKEQLAEIENTVY